MAIKVIQVSGQTCNKFWAWSRAIADGIATNDKIIILSPDITIKDYPNLKKNAIIKFPLYFEPLARFFGYRNYIKILEILFANKFSKNIIYNILKYIPHVEYFDVTTDGKRSKNKVKYEKFIKETFKPSDEIVAYCKEEFFKRKEKNTLIVGVHIRQGDYRSYLNGRYYYTLEVYKQVLNSFVSNFTEYDIRFFVASNEKNDLNIFNDMKYFKLEVDSSTNDLYALSLCDYIIGPPSTFSGWAAYLGNKPIYFIEDPSKVVTLNCLRSINEIWEG